MDEDAVPPPGTSAGFVSGNETSFSISLTEIIFYKTLEQKMDNYALVIDISSDEENNRYSTPIKTLQVNMVRRLNLSDSTVEVWRGSEADLESSQTSISLFNSEPEEAFVVEREKESESDDYYEEPDSSRDMPELTPAPVLKAITNAGMQEYPPHTKAEKLDDLSETSVREIEDRYGFNLDEGELHCLAGRGNSFTSARIQRLRKQPFPELLP